MCLRRLPFLTALHSPTLTLASEHNERIAEVGACNATAQFAKESARLTRLASDNVFAHHDSLNSLKAECLEAQSIFEQSLMGDTLP
jgi:hypothetical protein